MTFSVLFAAALAVPGPMRAHFRDSNVDISIRENKEEIRLTASYPKAQAKSVHQYINDYFGLNNLTELKAVDVKNYRTPDSSMNFYIKSRDGYLRIVLNRKTNTGAAYERIRGAAEGLKKILTGN